MPTAFTKHVPEVTKAENNNRKFIHVKCSCSNHFWSPLNSIRIVVCSLIGVDCYCYYFFLFTKRISTDFSTSINYYCILQCIVFSCVLMYLKCLRYNEQIEEIDWSMEFIFFSIEKEKKITKTPTLTTMSVDSNFSEFATGSTKAKQNQIMPIVMRSNW